MKKVRSAKAAEASRSTDSATGSTDITLSISAVVFGHSEKRLESLALETHLFGTIM
jgi:hypothetical protein